jgi:hypothetical protein
MYIGKKILGCNIIEMGLSLQKKNIGKVSKTVLGNFHERNFDVVTSELSSGSKWFSETAGRLEKGGPGSL